MISYEVSIGFILICVVLWADSFNLKDIVEDQRGHIFGLVNALVKPLFVFVTSPLLLLTLGFFLLIINAALLMLTSWVCAQFGVPWGVDGFWSAFWGALMVSIVSFVLNSFVGRRGEVHS